MDRGTDHAREVTDRYHTFLSLSGDGVARFELEPPLRVQAAEDAQVEHILRHARVAECNELFAGTYGRTVAAMTGALMGEFVPSGEPGRLQGIRDFIRAGYRLVYTEEEHDLGGGATRWLSASALGAPVGGELRDFWLLLRDITVRKRGELERERRGRILEAVAFCAARLLQAGHWRSHADEVVARLGEAAGLARAWIAAVDEPGERARMVFLASWGLPGQAVSLDDPRIRDGLSFREAGITRLEAALHEGRPMVTRVRDLGERERQFLDSMGSKAFAAVPISAHGRLWGVLGFGETRYEREWSTAEVEALKAAGAVLGAAVEREDAEQRQRRLEAELRLAAEEWRRTFDALDLGIVLADAEARIVRLNRGALEQLGAVAFAEVAGRKLETLAGYEPWRSLLDLHGRVGESRASVVAEAREPVSGRAFYLLGSPWPRGESEPPWRVLTFRDVTDFTNVQEQLRQARVMEAMGVLVAGVAHEVRNPLFSISATVDAVESTIGIDAELADHVRLLRSQVSRLTQLTRDLLDYGRPQALQRAPTELAGVVRRAVRACATLFEKRGVAMDERVAADLPRLQLDGARVEQALENLLTNAVHHSPRGARVAVTGELVTGEGQPWVRCSVEDQGPGVAAEHLAHVFEPFFTRRKGGTGLGLAIVRRLAEAHGGRVSVENRAEGGARFTLWLPLQQAAERGSDGG